MPLCLRPPWSPDADPRDLLAAAQSAVRTVGSSTACFAVLDGSRALLSIANLGDSGCRVVRRGALVLATSPQEHTFNMPYQLAHPDNLPDTDTAEDAQVCGPGLTGLHVVCRAGVILADNSGGRPHVPQYLRCARHGASAPTPVRAVLTSAPLVYDGTVRTVQVYQLALEPGDVIIMGTDGLYDNMWDEQIVALATGAVTALGPALGVTAGMAAAATAQPAAQQLAATLANTAFRHAQDPSFRSPWAVELANQPDVSRGAAALVVHTRGGLASVAYLMLRSDLTRLPAPPALSCSVHVHTGHVAAASVPARRQDG